MDFKEELKKLIVGLFHTLTSRTFWGIVVFSYLYLTNKITLEQFQNASLIWAGGTQLPKIVDILTIFKEKPNGKN